MREARQVSRIWESKPTMEGFQLWANLPASQKMMAPSYRDITSKQIPEAELNNDEFQSQ